jgi:hypothetical protein
MDDAKRMLEAYRARTVPDAATKAAMLQRLRDRGLLGEPRRLALVVALSVGIAAALLLALAAASHTLAPSSSAPRREEAVYGEAEGKQPRATEQPRPKRIDPVPPIAPPAVAPPAPSSPPPAVVRRAAPRPAAQAPSPEPTVPTPEQAPADSGAAASTIADEARLLKRAQHALRVDAPDRALAVLDEHARRFPAGVMALEREALRAIAACTGGRPHAREQARKVLARREAASYTDRIRRACDL